MNHAFSTKMYFYHSVMRCRSIQKNNIKETALQLSLFGGGER